MLVSSLAGAGCRYWLQDRRPRGRSSSPGRIKNFSSPCRLDIGFHPTSNPMDTGGFLPGVKRPWPEADHSPPASARSRKQ
jgi:hypothetical protein